MSDLFINVYGRRFECWFIASFVVDPQIFFKVNSTKIVVSLDLSTTIDQKEVMICFKSFIRTLDLFITVYGRYFEYWFIAGSCCGPANILKSEQYKNCCLIGGTASVNWNRSNDRSPIIEEYMSVLSFCIRKTFWNRGFPYSYHESDSFPGFVFPIAAHH